MKNWMVVLMFVILGAVLVWEIKNVSTLPIMEVSYSTGKCVGVRQAPEWELGTCDDKDLIKFEVVYVK